MATLHGVATVRQPMIPVVAKPEPADFNAKVRAPGNAALLELIGSASAPKRRGRKRPVVATQVQDIPGRNLPNYWAESLPDLRKAYDNVCAYLGMYIHEATGAATVDHFHPKSKYQPLAYEWTNYRLAAQQVNANKREFEDVLDPFQITAGWFELDIGTFEVIPSRDFGPQVQQQVDATIKRLKLNEPTFRKARERYHDSYLGLGSNSIGPLPEGWLKRECPFVFSELRRQGRLRPPKKPV